MSVKRAKKSKNEFDESMKRKSVAENISAGNSYEIVTSYPSSSISTTRMTSVNPQPASGRVITWDDTKFAIGICYFDEQLQYLQIYNIWVTQSPYTCRDYPYMSITIRKLDNAEITPLEIGDVRLMLADTVLPYEPYGATIWEDCAVKRYRIEHASGFYFENYKGLLCSANDTIPPGIWLVILGTATSNIIYSDPMFKNASKIIKLKKGKSYTLFLKNTTAPGYSDCNIGFLKNANDEVLLETAQLGLGEEVTTVYTPTEDEDTEVYFGISIPSGKEMKNADYYHYSIKPLQPEWEDTPEYVRQNGVWVVQT